MRNMKRLLLVIPFLLLSISLVAAPIGEKRAREIATNFFATATRSGATPSLDLAWVGNDMEKNLLDNATRSAQTSTSDDALLYIYNRTDAVGFVIVAGDDNAKREIIAFSFDNSFDTENMAEGAKAMLQAWCKDIAEKRNSNIRTINRSRAATSVGNIVRKYETAKWSQGEPYKNECPILIDSAGTKKIPPIGCGATALAIVCHYHKWPIQGVGTIPSYSYTDSKCGEIIIPENVLGRTYDYDKMLPTYKKGGYTEEQAAAVAALMYDVSTAITTKFHSGGSNTTLGSFDNAIIKYFNYSKQSLHIGRRGYSESEWIKLLQDNIFEYGPTIFRGTSSSGGGHAFVLDGYTDAGYFSVNYGWGGSSNGFYLMPDIKYIKSQAALFSAIPDRDGTSTYRNAIFTVGYNDCKGMLSQATKYEHSAEFKISIAVLNCGISRFQGSVCIAHCNKNHEIKDILQTYSISLSPNYKTRKNPTLTLSESIEEGDLLLVFYKGNEENWTRTAPYSTTTINSIPICCTPEEVAKNTTLEYDNETKTLSFSSPYATQCSIADASGNEVAYGEATAYGVGTVKLATLVAGEYTCSFAASSRPYTIKIKTPNNSVDESFNLPNLGSDTDNIY